MSLLFKYQLWEQYLFCLTSYKRESYIIKMSTKKEKQSRHLTRSVRLRKYESVYKTYIQNGDKKPCKKSRSPRPRRHRRHKETTEHRKHSREKKKEKKKKALNDYQKFVKKESKRDKYKNMRGSDRLHAIAIEWNTEKKKKSKRKEQKVKHKKS